MPGARRSPCWRWRTRYEDKTPAFPAAGSGYAADPAGVRGTDADADSNEIYNELADYYKQKEKNKSTTISSFSLPYLQGLTLDPVTCADGTQQDIGQLLYEGLVRLSLTLEPEPVLGRVLEL